MRKIQFGLGVLFFLSACAGNTTPIPDFPSAVPFLTATASKTPTLVPPVAEITQPTPTIFTYTVVQGDTIIGIAGRFGITPESLLAANSGVQASALSVGTKLIIPAGNATPAASAPTPVPVTIQQARCWTEANGGLWCFALVSNQYADMLENLSAQFILLDASGNQIGSGTAFGLLDILSAGESIPLAVHFPPQEVNYSSIQVQLLTAIRLLPGDPRYLPAVTLNSLVKVDSSGVTAEVTGQVILTNPGTANTTWVLATAFDSTGNVVGVRRWESTSVLTDHTPVSFDFQLSSIGPGIARVEFLVEARP